MPLGRGVAGTIKQTFSMSTLIECECVEGKVKAKSQVSKLLDKIEVLKREMEDFTTLVAEKELEITPLKALLQQAKSQGPGNSADAQGKLDKLRVENTKMTDSNSFLSEEVKSLTKQLIQAHTNAIIE